MKKTKIIFLIIFCFSLFPVASENVNAFDDTYVTSYTENYTYYTTERRWVSCRWIKIHDIYMCNNGWIRGGSECNSCCGGIAYDYGYDDLRNSCTGATVCDNVAVPNPGGYWEYYQQARTGSRTITVCNYICGVNSWSSCSAHTQSATSVKYCSTSGSSCSRTVPLTQYCNNPPVASIVTPNTGLTYDKHNYIDFSGTATDPDGDSIATYQWYDGGCGSGTYLFDQASFSTNGFEPGNHTVYFRAQDDQGAWSDCDSVSFTIRPTCDPETAPAGSAFCAGDNENIPGTSNVSAVRVNSVDNCTSSRKCEYYMLPINGSVGSANSEVYCQRPTENLCSEGTPSDVTEGDGGKSWIWTCQGLYGGNDAEGKAVKSCAYQEVTPN